MAELPQKDIIYNVFLINNVYYKFLDEKPKESNFLKWKLMNIGDDLDNYYL